MLSECWKLAQKKYKSTVAWVGKVIKWELCKRIRFDHADKWYMYKSESVVENEMHLILCDSWIQTDYLTQTRRPDLVLIYLVLINYSINKKKKNLSSRRFYCPSEP